MKDKPKKKAILLVAFGSSIGSARESLTAFGSKVMEEFPGITIHWAFTSAFIRKKLKKEGIEIDSPLMALTRLAEDGFTHVAVQSLHTIPGVEYDFLVQTVKALESIPKGIEQIEIGKPLLYHHQDIEKAVKAISNSVPVCKQDEAVVLMGHGSPHINNVYYPGLNYYLSHYKLPVYMGTVEGFPTIKEVINQLKEKSIRKVFLLPFMSVAGNHVKNDMCGDHDESWENILIKEGFEVEPILKGTLEMEAYAQIWIDHLKTAFEKL